MDDDPKFFLFDLKMLTGEMTPLWQDDREFLEIYHDIQNFTLVSPFRLYSLFQFSKLAKNYPGAWAQVGIYKGGSAMMLARIKQPETPFFLFDTFQGLPKEDKDKDFYLSGRFADTSVEEVQTHFNQFSNVHIISGLFPDSAAEEHRRLVYSFVYLDVDLYHSNFNSLEFFYPRMIKGGCIMIDDYGWKNAPGIKTSTNDFLKKNKIGNLPILTARYQCLIIKN